MDSKIRNSIIVIGLITIALLVYYYSEKTEIIITDTKAPEVKPKVKTNKVKKSIKKLSVDMILINKGTFQMGSNVKKDEKSIDSAVSKARKSHDFELSNNGLDDENPIHSVTISEFYIGKYEVTQAQWKSVMKNNPSNRRGDNNPVEKVSWYDAVEFCNKLSEMNGLEKCYTGSGNRTTCDFSANGYRLPTEAEWEYAASGGESLGFPTNFKYSGSDRLNDVGWYRSNSAVIVHTIGKKKPNEIGIYDMSGNVWEWCWDWYDPAYYRNSPDIDPKGPSMNTNRAIRGGSWGGGACLLSYCKPKG
ncbi:MAG: SUMF1/EgtB/PvdO family nonheme iron enzyme [Candidatus Delongbacteria bacterium]|nr:SUMF1/EgtB/PvdO family nonheme iron enzyme [Candidatus Delongbacteria bacterium]